MDRQQIDDLVEGYNSILKSEAGAQRALRIARSMVEYEGATAAQAGYNQEAIKGSNKEARDRAEKLYLHEHVGYQVVLQLLEKAEFEAALMTANRKATEAEISLVKAYLYSQAGIE